MLFCTVKSILDRSIATYACAERVPESTLDRKVGERIVAISDAHYNPALTIDYSDFPSRLAYIYVHAAANATLFQRTVAASEGLRRAITAKAGDRLSVAALGGGPGTELLGLIKYLRGQALPRRIDFRVLDQVHEWSDSWEQMAAAGESTLAQHCGVTGEDVVISPMFNPIDVMDVSAYQPYATAFSSTDVLVLNYILSENQDRLDTFGSVLEVLVRRAKAGAYFVFIDRRQHSLDLDVRVVQWCAQLGLVIETNTPMPARNIDNEDKVDPDLGDYPRRFRSPGASRDRWPRLRFFKDTPRGRYPTAFCVVARKA